MRAQEKETAKVTWFLKKSKLLTGHAKKGLISHILYLGSS